MHLCLFLQKQTLLSLKDSINLCFAFGDTSRKRFELLTFNQGAADQPPAPPALPQNNLTNVIAWSVSKESGESKQTQVVKKKTVESNENEKIKLHQRSIV